MGKVYKLIPEIIREKIDKSKCGVYFLGKFKKEGFYVGYVGRSDTCIRRRLLDHAKSGKYAFFSYKVLQTKESSFRQEALLFYSHFGLSNKIVPASNNRKKSSLTYCDCEIAALLKGQGGN